jgi:hypothetical protein
VGGTATGGDLLALLALALRRWRRRATSGWPARAYGSIIDMFPAHADFPAARGAAAARAPGQGQGLELALEQLLPARAQARRSPRQPPLCWPTRPRSGAGQRAPRSDAILEGLKHPYPGGRFRGADRIMRDDVGVIAAVLLRETPPAARQQVSDGLSVRGHRDC